MESSQPCASLAKTVSAAGVPISAYMKLIMSAMSRNSFRADGHQVTVCSAQRSTKRKMWYGIASNSLRTNAPKSQMPSKEWITLTYTTGLVTIHLIALRSLAALVRGYLRMAGFLTNS